MNGYSLSDKSITLYAHETSDKNGVKLTFFNGLIAKSGRPNEGDQKNIINIRKAFDITIHSKNAEAFKNYIKLKGTIRITEEKPGSEEIIIDVVRKRSNQYITVSELSIRGTNIKGAALELGKGTAAESKAACTEIRSNCYECKRIPAGEFLFEVNKIGRQGQHKYKTLRLLNTKVKGSQRDGILIHMGDALSWTQGCLLAMYDNEIEKIIEDDSNIYPSLMGYWKGIDERNAGRTFILSIIEFIEEKEKRLGKSISKKVIIKDDKDEQTLIVNTRVFDQLQMANRYYYNNNLYNKAVAQFELFAAGLQEKTIRDKLQTELDEYTKEIISTLTKENYKESEVKALYETYLNNFYAKKEGTITIKSMQQQIMLKQNEFIESLKLNFEKFIKDEDIIKNLFNEQLNSLFHKSAIESFKDSNNRVGFVSKNYTQNLYDTISDSIKSKLIEEEISKIERYIKK